MLIGGKLPVRGRKMISTNNLQLIEDSLKIAFEGKRERMREVLQSAEDSFISNMQAHIIHHKYLLESALEQNDIKRIAYHQIMIETFQSILINYTRASKTI